MYDNNIRFLDFLFDSLINEYFEKTTPAELAASQSRADLDIALKKVADGRKVIRGEDDLAEIESAIGDYTYAIENEALRQGLYTGFRAARELLTGVSI